MVDKRVILGRDGYFFFLWIIVEFSRFVSGDVVFVEEFGDFFERLNIGK